MSSPSRKYRCSVDFYPLLDQYSDSLRAILQINEGSGVIGIPFMRNLQLHIIEIFGILNMLVSGTLYHRPLMSAIKGVREILDEVVDILSEVQELTVVPQDSIIPLSAISLAILYYLSQTFQDILNLMEFPTEQESRYASLLSSVRAATEFYPVALEDFNVPIEIYGKFRDIIFFMITLRGTFGKTTTADAVGIPNTKETYSPHAAGILSVESGKCEPRRCVPKEENKIVRSAVDEYEFLEHVGRGSYGKVAKFFKIGTQEKVVLKVTRSTYSSNKAFVKECKMCRRLNKEDPDNLLFVRALDIFGFRGKGVIAFECLGPSLQQCLTEPFSLGKVSVIAKQLFVALVKLKQLRIIHTDIKPDNILFVDPLKQPLRVKLIDFGVAIDMENETLPDIVQPLAYRAPEVLLGLSYSEAVDMWSVGCVLAQLFLGHPLFDGKDEGEQMQLICGMQGLPPEKMLDSSPKAEDFFYRETERGSSSGWLLKKNSHYMDQTADSNQFKFKGFIDVFDMLRKGHLSFESSLTVQTRAEMNVKRRFADLLKKLLCLNPDKRITPEEALEHMFLYSFQHCSF